jgi:hypothetical protein
VYVVVARLPPLLVVKGQTRIWGTSGEDEDESRDFFIRNCGATVTIAI